MKPQVSRWNKLCPSRPWCRCLAAAALLYSGHAACADTTSGPQIDRKVEALKSDVLDAAVDAEAAQQKQLCPQGCIGLYLGYGASSPRLKSASLTIDDHPEVHHDFDAAEAAALASGGLYRAARMPKPPHHLRLQFTLDQPAGAASDAPPPDPILYDDDVELAEGTTDIVLNADSGLLSAAKFDLTTLTRDNGSHFGPMHKLLGFVGIHGTVYLAGEPQDPQLRYAHFLRDAGQVLAACVQMRELQDSASREILHKDFYRDYAEQLADYGLLKSARSAYERVQSAGGARPSALAQLKIRLAEALYERGDYKAAAALLTDPPEHASDALRESWADVRSRVLLAQGFFDEASQLLVNNENRADLDAYITYFNLGIALVRDGRVAQGITALDRVGSVITDDPQMRALRDRANLTVGFHFLRNGQGATAIPILERISSVGPYSDRALLDLGWAWLAPAGSKQEQVKLGDERTVGPPPESHKGRLPNFGDTNLYQRFHIHPFARADLSADTDARIHHALSAWMELLRRNQDSQAAQEALLALGDTYEGAGGRREARMAFERAVVVLERAGKSVQLARAYVEGKGWLLDLLPDPSDDSPDRFDRSLAKLPPLRQSTYLLDVLAGNAFQHAFGQYRDLRQLQQAVAGIDASLPPAGDGAADDNAELRVRIARLRESLASSTDAQQDLIRELVLKELDERQQFNEHLLQQARLALAQAYDNKLPPDRLTPEP